MVRNKRVGGLKPKIKIRFTALLLGTQNHMHKPNKLESNVTATIWNEWGLIDDNKPLRWHHKSEEIMIYFPIFPARISDVLDRCAFVYDFLFCDHSWTVQNRGGLWFDEIKKASKFRGKKNQAKVVSTLATGILWAR